GPPVGAHGLALPADGDVLPRRVADSARPEPGGSPPGKPHHERNLTHSFFSPPSHHRYEGGGHALRIDCDAHRDGRLQSTEQATAQVDTYEWGALSARGPCSSTIRTKRTPESRTGG